MTAKKEGVTFDPKEFLSRIGTGRTNADYRADDIVYFQGDAADAVYYLQNGKVKITVTSENGKEAVIAILGLDDFFGEGCLNGQSVRLSTVRAMTDCSIMRLEKTAMMRTLHAEPKFADLFIGHLLPAKAASKRIWSISCSIHPKNVWPACFCCWLISARTASRSR